jgi:hypothetical protein
VIVIDFGNDEKMMRTISTTRSYLSQTELTATFGLGNREPKELKVLWPDGSEQKVPIEKLDSQMLIEQGT